MSKLRKMDLLREAWGALGANKLRSGLTVLGMTIGVFSVVGVMTVLSAISASLNTSLNVFGANVFQVSREPAIQVGGPGEREWQARPRIKPRQAYDFADRMADHGVIVTVRGSDGGERAVYEGRRTSPRITIHGTNENFLITNKYEIAEGRNLSRADLEFNFPAAVIGQSIVEELFPREDPLGKVITLDDNRYTVVGILKRRGDLFGQSLDDIALIPVTRFVANNWHRWRSMRIAVQAPTSNLLEATQELAITEMRAVRGLAPEDANDFELTSNESLQQSLAQISFVVGTGGLVISAIALICSGIGIMNIMLVSVTERTREIGVRKSLGARKVDILRQFLLEAVGLSLLGAAIGIVLGWGVGTVVAAHMNAAMVIPWFWIGSAVGVCAAIGIGFGFYPAWRAAGLHPVEALRYE